MSKKSFRFFRFNTKIDSGGECPECKKAKRKMDILSTKELEEYQEHLRVMHGMYP